MTSNSTEPINARLTDFCKEVSAHADQIDRLLGFDSRVAGSQPTLPAELKEKLSMLRERARRPEINVLLFGPLKAGKSTLMNLLLDNPLVSQVTQLPAYPCTVEVRDLRRGPEGEPQEEEQTLFYPADNGKPEKMSFKQGQDRLERLLADFKEAGDKAVIKYPRVEQRVDLKRSPKDPNLVVYDSPGLFFSTWLENTPQQQPGSEPGSGYSSATEKLFDLADIAIFIIRPEQLFQNYVAQWLRDFKHKMRFFILVNGSRQAFQWRDKEIVEYDQILNQKEIKEYFDKHVAGPTLVGLIQQKTRVSLHFTDLLEVARRRFVNEEELPDCLNNPYGEALNEINQYIRGDSLADKKIESLGELRNGVIQSAWNHLSDVKAVREMRLAELENERENLADQVKSKAEEIEKLEKELHQTRRELEASQFRRQFAEEVIKHGIGDIDAKSDTEAGRLKALSAMQLGLKNTLAKQSERVESEIKAAIKKTFLAWKETKKTGLGERNLRLLADTVWTHKTQDGTECLRDQYKSHLEWSARNFFMGALDEISEESSLYKAVLKSSKSKTLDIPLDNPVTQDSLRLLPFDAVNKMSGNKSWFSGKYGAFWVLNAAKLWGEDGEKSVDSSRDDFLRDHVGHFVDCIWGEPWKLKDLFDPINLETKARQIGIKEICRQWKEILIERINSLKVDLEKIGRLIAKSREELGQLDGQLAELERKIEEARDRIIEVGERIDGVECLGLSVNFPVAKENQ